MSTIDPRYIKQLLQAQLKTNLDGLSASSGDSDSGDSFDFASILNTIMMGVSDERGASTDLPQPPKSNSALSALVALGLKQQPALYPQQPQSATSSYDAIVQMASTVYGVDAKLIHSVIEAESGYRPNAVSSAGAKGLMQLMDGTANQLGVSDALDPVQNIYGGTRYLSSLLNRYDGNEAMALAAYNAGPGRVDKLGVRSDEQLMAKISQLPLETQKYVASIMARRNQVSSIGGTF